MEQMNQFERSSIVQNEQLERKRQSLSACEYSLNICFSGLLIYFKITSMSVCKQFGKDKVVFMSQEDAEKPSSIVLPPDDEPRGLIMPDGSINWNCPCIGGTASGPCGFEFREAFTCFHYSTSETKGSECLDKFTALNECMAEFPTLYSKNKPEEEIQEELDNFDKDRVDQELKSLDEKLDKKDKADKK